uniref:hypothetical protein n=1 Tax=Oscillatoria sp. HE19RPO TaxID=2954806 RepID=UPI0020C296A7
NGNLTNLIAGDYNGDGKTDFIRQEKDIWASQDDMHMADLYLSNGDGTFAKRSMQPLWNELNGNLVNIVSSYA